MQSSVGLSLWSKSRAAIAGTVVGVENSCSLQQSAPITCGNTHILEAAWYRAQGRLCDTRSMTNCTVVENFIHTLNPVLNPVLRSTSLRQWHRRTFALDHLRIWLCTGIWRSSEKISGSARHLTGGCGYCERPNKQVQMVVRNQLRGKTKLCKRRLNS